jgi:hypothetical protein
LAPLKCDPESRFIVVSHYLRLRQSQVVGRYTDFEEARDFPIYCQRPSFFPEVPEYEAVAELFLPLK